MTVAALILCSLAAMRAPRVWPAANQPTLDQPGSPGVVREGARLVFTGPVPWVGHQVGGEHAGRRISFGDAPPDEDPPPKAWQHYAPDRITIQTPNGMREFTPEEFERTLRFGHVLSTFIVNFVVVAIFYFVLTLLLGVKGVRGGPSGPLTALGRCVVPACVLSAGVSLLGTPRASDLAAGVFVLILAVNVLTLVLRARPTPEPQPFDV